jgi:membrane protein DedA with SNARE-associated domain/rhodanese-related sulfurtransferase
MSTFKVLLLHHAYSLLFGWVLIEQAGVPVPSIPVMLAAGTLSASHKLHIAYAIGVILVASLIADSGWYWLGRRYGRKILDFLCRFSLESSTCVVKTQGTMGRRGASTLLFAKFVPGLSTMAPPIAGQAKIPFSTFLLYDGLGTLVWATTWLLAGRFFGDIAEKSQRFYNGLGHFAVLLVAAAVIAVIVWRIVKLRQFRSQLVELRLEPHELHSMICVAKDGGLELPFIVDLRHPLDVLADPLVLPGAVRIGPDDLKSRSESIPRDRDVVLYCTCPSEETSAKVALELRRLGVLRVRPLRGGLKGWKDAGYPLDEVISVV